MEQIKMEPIANSDNTAEPTATDMPETEPNASVGQVETKESVSESTAAVASKSTDKRHSLVYLAGGIWKDNKDVYWCREDRDNCVSSMVLTDSEYNERLDIQFMVEHNLIKDVVVE